MGPCRKRCKGENAGLEFDSCRRSSVENFPCPKPVGGKPRCFLFQTYLNWWFDLNKKISEAEIQFSSKTPQLLQGDTHVSIGVKDIFWDIYLKMTGVRQTFPTKIQVGKVFFGPKDQNLEWKACSLLARCSDLVQQLSVLGLVTRHWVIRNHPKSPSVFSLHF